MSDLENPYKSPESPIVPDMSQSSGALLTDNMLQFLYEASPWLRFLGILGYIGCGMMVVGGIGSAIVMVAASSLAAEFGDVPLWLIALIYVPMGALMFFPARFTYNFGEKIRSYKLNKSSEDLELAFKNNKSLWKFSGILCIIYLAIIPVVFVVTIIVTVVANVTA